VKLLCREGCELWSCGVVRIASQGARFPLVISSQRCWVEEHSQPTPSHSTLTRPIYHSANSEHLGVTVSASLNFRSFKTETRPNAFTKLSKHSPAPQTSVGSCARTMEFSRASTSVIIVGGGGTIGSSTALHLVRSGYTPSNITVLDTYPIPSAQSAGNDLNKVMGIRLRNKVDLQLSLEARQMWSEDDLFKEFFHKTGRVSSIK
jgi:hypothetical protein